MEKKKVLITGITGSIGKATALEFAKNNCHLILLGRNREKVEAVKSEISKKAGNHDIDVVIADLSEPETIREAVIEINKKNKTLDALINIAALFHKDRIENSKGYELMIATNHLGPFVLTNEVLPLLEAGKGRIITVTAPSTTKVNFDDLHGKNKFSAGFLGSFGASKMMNILFTYRLAKKLEGSGVIAMAFHPGLVKSRLTREMPLMLNSMIQLFSGKPDKAAHMLYKLAIDPVYKDANGKFYKFDGKEMKTSKYSYDNDVQEKLWSVSEQLAK